MDAKLPFDDASGVQTGAENYNQNAASSQGRQNAPTTEKIGAILRSYREQRGESLYDISEYLRIRPTFLSALENGRYDKLPPDAYVIGFLKTYADYLGLDSRAAIDLYRREMAGRRRKPQLSMPQPIAEGRAPTVAIMIAGTLAAIMLYALWYSLSSSNRASVELPPPTPQTAHILETPTIVAPSPPAQPAAATTAPQIAPLQPLADDSIKLSAPVSATESLPSLGALAKPAPFSPIAPASTDTAEPQASESVTVDTKPEAAPKAASRVVVRAEEEAWVLIVDKKGNTVYDKIMAPGDTFNVPDMPGLKLTTGNGAGVAISVDGVDLSRLSAESHIVRNYGLDPDKIKAKKAPPSD